MKNKVKSLGIVAAVVMIGLSTVGCVTTPLGQVQIGHVHWSAYTVIPSKGYVVVGAIVLRNVNLATVLADLMERAIEMGGHDIINVRISSTRPESPEGAVTGRGTPAINIATAVVIRFTEEVLMDSPQLWHVDIGTPSVCNNCGGGGGSGSGSDSRGRLLGR